MSENALILWDDQDKLAEVKKIFAPTLTPTEFQAFVGIGQSTGLNPFLKEIWAVKYGNGAASIFVGRDGYRKGAQANKDYDWHFVDSIYEKDSFRVVNGQPEHEYSLGERGKLIGAYGLCMRKGSSKPNFNRISLSEYTTGQSLWKTKPETMIKKVAEAQVLRMTFQDMFGGTHDESEEFDNTNVPDAVAPDNLTQRISGKTTEHVEAQVEEVQAENIQEEQSVTYISEGQSSIITNLFTQLGYDPAMINEKVESLERQLRKPYDQFTTEEADSIISNMAKALKKKTEEEVPKEEEEKKTAVGAIGEKAKEENKKTMNDPEFIKTFEGTATSGVKIEEPIVEEVSAEEVQDMFTSDEKPLEDCTEDELNQRLHDAKVLFSDALKAHKANPTDENFEARSRASNACAEVNQMIAKNGYKII